MRIHILANSFPTRRLTGSNKWFSNDDRVTDEAFSININPGYCLNAYSAPRSTQQINGWERPARLVHSCASVWTAPLRLNHGPHKVPPELDIASCRLPS